MTAADTEWYGAPLPAPAAARRSSPAGSRPCSADTEAPLIKTCRRRPSMHALLCSSVTTRRTSSRRQARAVVCSRRVSASNQRETARMGQCELVQRHTLPPPLGPTSALLLPGSRSIVTPLSTAASSRDGYENLWAETRAEKAECSLVSVHRQQARRDGRSRWSALPASSPPLQAAAGVRNMHRHFSKLCPAATHMQ